MSPANQHPPASSPAAAHLPVAVLRQYAAGTLSAAERRRVELHSLACPLCADALDGYLLAPAAAVAPPALAELRDRLHARVAAEPAQSARPAWGMAAAAAVVVLLIAVGLWLRPDSRPVATAPQKRSAPAPVVYENPAPAATAPTVASAPAPEAAANAVKAPAAKPEAAKKPARKLVYAAAPSRAVRSQQRATSPDLDLAAAPSLAVDDVVVSGSAADAAADAPAPAAATIARAATPSVAQQEQAETVDSESVAPVVPGSALAPSAAKANTAVADGIRRKAALPPVPAIAPMPAGGHSAFNGYLRRELRWPDEAKARNISGVVRLKFTVEADGTLQNIQVLKSLHPECDAEAVRLICEGPAWHPGIEKGRRASLPVQVEVPFRGN